MQAFPEQADWRRKFEAEGYDVTPATPVRIDSELLEILQVRARGRASDDALAALSVERFRNGRIPRKFPDRWIRRARAGSNVRFDTAYGLALLLNVEPRDLILMVPDTEPEPDTDPGDLPLPGGRRAGWVGHDIVGDISLWIRITTVGALAVAAGYALFVENWFLELRIAFPGAGIGTALACGYLSRRHTRFPMPLNLRLLFGLVFGLVTGAGAFLAIAVRVPHHLCGFRDDWSVQVAVAAYLVGAVAAYSLGHRLGGRRLRRKVYILTPLTFALLVLAILAAWSGSPCGAA